MMAISDDSKFKGDCPLFYFTKPSQNSVNFFIATTSEAFMNDVPTRFSLAFSHTSIKVKGLSK